MKPWQNGYDIELLKQISAPFKSEYKPYVFGAFGIPKERDVAISLKAGRLVYSKDFKNVFIYNLLKRDSVQRAFNGVACRIDKGSYFISNIASAGKYNKKWYDRLFSKFHNISVEIFQEHPGQRALLKEYGYYLSFVKIKAGSEIKGVYTNMKINAGYFSKADMRGICLLKKNCLTNSYVNSIRAEIEQYSTWADHYSTYNKRKSWQAFSLRGFIPKEPQFIEKPAEMSQGWKDSHKNILQNVCQDTIIYKRFPTVKKIIKLLKIEPERVRFMKLKAKVGELSRHADITDRAAGTLNGSIARLHIPIQTNDSVYFNSWALDGRMSKVKMKVGNLYYLDTRKPHRAVNLASTDRLHLVIDAKCNQRLRDALTRG